MHFSPPFYNLVQKALLIIQDLIASKWQTWHLNSPLCESSTVFITFMLYGLESRSAEDALQIQEHIQGWHTGM